MIYPFRRLPGHYVQIAGGDPRVRTSIGIEVCSGQAWLGVDQQIGHRSGDALFALTVNEYEAALANEESIHAFRLDCWSGNREDRLMFYPGGDAWTPELWTPDRHRMLEPKFVGELWHHVDALDSEEGSEQWAISAALSAGKATVENEATGGVRRMTFRLDGDGAYPRPGGLIAGLGAGSTRDQVRDVLGQPSRGVDTYPLEGDLLELCFEDGGLSLVAVIRPAPRPIPDGAIRGVLAAVGTPEEGHAFRELLQRADAGKRRRWMPSTGVRRRLITFDSGMEIQTEHATVLSVRVPLGVARFTEALFPGVRIPPTRADVERMLGPASDSTAGAELRTYGDRELVVLYDNDGGTASELTALPRGTTVWHSIHRWRSGEFSQFVDVLGMDESHPLVTAVRERDGVRIDTRHGAVSAVTIGMDGYQRERFAAFVDGVPAEPVISHRMFGAMGRPSEQDALYPCDGGWIHAHADDGSCVSWIRVGQDRPRIPGPQH